METVYSLLIYILYSSIEEINDTLFVFGKGIKEDIRRRLPNHEYIDVHCSIYHKIIRTLLLRRRIRKNYKLRGASYWGHDSQFYSGAI